MGWFQRHFHYKVSKKRRNPREVTDPAKEETKTSQQDANISTVLGSPADVQIKEKKKEIEEIEENNWSYLHYAIMHVWYIS